MVERAPVDDLVVNLEESLGRVGDRKRVTGQASMVVGDAYELELLEGEGGWWSVELLRISGGVEVTGVIEGALTLKCARCLEEFEFPFRLEIREHFLVLDEIDMRPADDYGGEYVAVEGSLDLEPVFRDAICLAIPSKRICSESCRGLCSKCGANLNVEECSCDRRAVDVRLKPLEDLKRRMEEEDEGD